MYLCHVNVIIMYVCEGTVMMECAYNIKRKGKGMCEKRKDYHFVINKLHGDVRLNQFTCNKKCFIRSSV